MERLVKNAVIVFLVLTVTVFFLSSCAKKQATKPSETVEPAKPAASEAPPPKAPAPKETAPAPTPPPASPPPKKQAAPAEVPPPPPPAKPPEASKPAPERTTEIVPGAVNLRQGPSMDAKIVTVLKKGTKLTVLEEKLGWLHVKTADGTEGWVGKAMTSEGAQPKKP